MYLFVTFLVLVLPKIALSYHMDKQHLQNVLSLNTIITNNPLFNMQIIRYTQRGRFKLVITLYLNLIAYVVIKLQANFLSPKY